MSARQAGRVFDLASTGGFTLVEVMVALVILALGALALTHLSLSIAVLMQQSTAKTELIALAENRLERVQARDYDDIDPGTELDTVSVRGKPYVRRITITAPNARTRQIQVDLRSSQDPLTYSTLTYVSAP
jgi:prepilin-type N-terminal cleavage/methylation domain-containing protein